LVRNRRLRVGLCLRVDDRATCNAQTARDDGDEEQAQHKFLNEHNHSTSK
jgi:hypothetical protein